MIQEEIQQRSEQIALMLGWQKWDVNGVWYKTDSISKFVVYSEHNNYPHKGLPFHRDWNWLMQPIQFLQKYFESKELYWTTIERYPLFTDIETVFIMVSDFAKLYNEGKL